TGKSLAARSEAHRSDAVLLTRYNPRIAVSAWSHPPSHAVRPGARGLHHPDPRQGSAADRVRAGRAARRRHGPTGARAPDTVPLLRVGTGSAERAVARASGRAAA